MQVRRKIGQIARDIEKDWEKPYFGAVPYISALKKIDEAQDFVGFEQGRTLIAAFLSNAQTWRGPIARAIKKELKEHYEEQKLVDEVESKLKGSPKAGWKKATEMTLESWNPKS